MRKNISAKAFETCRVACPHGFCVADDSCSLPISKCTRRRNELRSFRFQVRICTVTSSHIYNFGCREVSLCCCREVRVEDNVRHSVTLKMFFVLSCFGVASRILRSALAPSKGVHRGRVHSHVGGCEVAGLDFSVFCVVQCGVSFGHACVCDNTHFAIQS